MPKLTLKRVALAATGFAALVAIFAIQSLPHSSGKGDAIARPSSEQGGGKGGGRALVNVEKSNGLLEQRKVAAPLVVEEDESTSLEGTDDRVVYTEEDLSRMSVQFESIYGGLDRKQLRDAFYALRETITTPEFIELHVAAYRNGDYVDLGAAKTREDGFKVISLPPSQTRGMRPMFERIWNTKDGRIVKSTLKAKEVGERAALFAEAEWLANKMRGR